MSVLGALLGLFRERSRERGRRSARAVSGFHTYSRRTSEAWCGVESLEPRMMLSGNLYVDVNSPGPTHDGSSWANAYVDLQAALGAAASGNQNSGGGWNL